MSFFTARVRAQMVGTVTALEISTTELKFRDAAKPVFDELYGQVSCGNEAQRSIDSNSRPDYREKLEKELQTMRESEMWQAGAVVRKLRPENN